MIALLKIKNKAFFPEITINFLFIDRKEFVMLEKKDHQHLFVEQFLSTQYTLKIILQQFQFLLLSQLVVRDHYH
jgi:hypothetical protein